jgi:5-(aminomethyl)-3-furanmethanol phosphate kinase
MDWVVKVGGSLFPEKAIELCESIIALNNSYRSPKKIVFICGGGSFANKIRAYDQDIHFSDTASHSSAIMCMDIIGTLLADKVEGLEVAKSIDNVKSILNRGNLPVLIPSNIFESHDPFEHSWRVSSDSLAVYISDLLEAKLLIATDVDGIYTHNPSRDDAKLIKFISAKKLLNFGETSVDEFLPGLLIRYNSNCYVVNGKYPDRVLSIIEGKSSKYTLIGGN